LPEAYARLHDALGALESSGTIAGWESSDEWYDHDGEPMTEDAIVSVRMGYFDAPCAKCQAKEHGAADCPYDDDGAARR
jgi:hypothetical protein